MGKDHLWKSGPTPAPFWDWYKDWGWTDEQFIEFCNDGVDAGYIFRGPLREGFADAVNRVKALGHKTVMITDRSFGSTPQASIDATCETLAENDLEFDELIFHPDKTVVKTDFFVEDKLANYDKLEEAGTMVFLVNRAWNHVDGGDKRFRIDSVSEYADIVEMATALDTIAGFTRS